MRGKIISSLMFFLVIFSISVYSSRIYGTIYTIDLHKAEGAIITINSSTAQTYVAKEGEYSFVLDKGDYLVSVRYTDGKDIFASEQRVKIISEGEYIQDIILLPDLSEEESMTENILSYTILDFDDIGKETSNYTFLVWILIILVFSSLFLVYKYFFKNKKRVQKKDVSVDVDDLAEKIIDFVKDNQGRTTQKEIRKNFPFSEAKISLVITELEHEGKIRKIKKGKGNIISLSNEK